MGKGRERNIPRQMKPVFLVFCEGETEENYVDFIRRQYKSPIKIVPKTAGASISQRLINNWQSELKISKEEKITTFLMYDLDVAPVVEKLESCKAVWLCSNPCIEFWFLLHCQSQTAALQTEQCYRILRKSNEVWLNYQKPLLSTSQKKVLWENKTIAIERAKTLAEKSNPSSSVYKLIEAINEHKK